MASADDAPAATTFALEALPPDVSRRILRALACPERPGAPQRLRALQPATLTCRAWRAAARQLVCQLTFKGGRAEAYKGRDLSAFPQLSRLVFEREIRAGDAAQLLLTLPAPHNQAPSAAARTVSGGGSEAHNDRTDGALSQQHRASASGGSCCGGSRGGLRDISGGASHRTGSALHVCGLPLPLPAALTSLTRLDVSLLAPPPPDYCTLGPAQWRAHAPGRRLAAALDALPLLIHLRVRDAPPACAELAEALPRAARLRELVVAREGGLINYPAGCAPPCRLAASDLFWAGATQLESLTVPADLPSVFERVTALTSLTFDRSCGRSGAHPACCEGLGRLARLRRLDTGTLYWHVYLAGRGLELCSRLTSIRLDNAVCCLQDGDGVLEILEGLRSLRSLDVSGCRLHASKVATLAALTELSVSVAPAAADGDAWRLPGSFSQLSILVRLSLDLFLGASSGADSDPSVATTGISVLSSLPALRELSIDWTPGDRRAVPMRELNFLTQITALSLTSDAYGEDLAVAQALPTALAGLRSLNMQVCGARLVASPTDSGGSSAGPSLASLTRLEARVGSGACELLSPRLLPSSLRALSLRADDPDDEAAAAALLAAPAPPAPALRRLESLELRMLLRAGAWRVPAWLPALAGTLESVRLPGIIGQLEEMRSRVQGELSALDAVARMGVREIKVEFAVKDALEAAAGQPGARSSWVLLPPPPRPRAELLAATDEGAAAVCAAARAFLRNWEHLLVLVESRQ